MADKEKEVEIEELGRGVIRLKGTDKEFQQNKIRTIWVAAKSLYIATTYDGGPQSRISGIGSLSKDTLSVIGLDEIQTKEIPFSIWPRDIPDFKDELDLTGFSSSKNEPDDEEESPFTAVLGYLEYDWEIGNDSQFFLELGVSKRIFDHLVESIRREGVSKLEVGLKSHDLYIRRYDTHAPPSMRVTWFLPPDRSSGKASRPDVARGWLTALNLEHKSIRLEAQPSEDTSEVHNSDGAVSSSDVPVSTPDRNSEAERKLLESIAKSLQMLPWFVIGAALLIVLSR